MAPLYLYTHILFTSTNHSAPLLFAKR